LNPKNKNLAEYSNPVKTSENKIIIIMNKFASTLFINEIRKSLLPSSKAKNNFKNNMNKITIKRKKSTPKLEKKGLISSKIF
jgi:hypothetical protein